MTRETIGAGVAMNTRDHLRVWLNDPNAIKPGALMPAMNLDDRDLDDLVAYLATLR
jgi:cytochrome c oxidase subunit II